MLSQSDIVDIQIVNRSNVSLEDYYTCSPNIVINVIKKGRRKGVKAG